MRRRLSRKGARHVDKFMRFCGEVVPIAALVRRVAYGGRKGKATARRLYVYEDLGFLKIVDAIDLRLAEEGWLRQSDGLYRRVRFTRWA
jgi:hypothetical protein